MAGIAAKFLPRELLIHTPDGATRPLALERERYSLGRSSANELCYPEDAGLSRQHLALEREGDTWMVRDLGSKNGTFVNGVRITSPYPLSKNDRVTAGHIALDFAENSLPPMSDHTVVFIEGATPASTTSTTVATSLKGVLGQDDKLEGTPQMRALIRAGRELAGNMPLGELFKLIMNLSVDAVGATRGVLMTLEGKELVPQAALGEGFRISSTVRDRVIKEKTSLLVRDARLDEAFADRMSIVQQQIRSMLAVPLQTDDRVIGLIYLDSPHFIHEFTKDDLSLLTVMANVAAIRIEHTRLAEVEQTERLHAKELDQAADIQRGLLPVKAPEVPGVDLAGYNAACRTVGGDYYDFLPYPDGRVGLLVGDVAGKGMPAALADVEFAGARAGAVRRAYQSGRAGYAAEPHHLHQLPFQPLHHILHRRAGSQDRRAGLCQCRPQSAAGGACRWLGGKAGRHRIDPGDSAQCELSTGLLPDWIRATWWCCSATASPRPRARRRRRVSARTGWRRFCRASAIKARNRSFNPSTRRSMNSPAARRPRTTSPWWWPSA